MNRISAPAKAPTFKRATRDIGSYTQDHKKLVFDTSRWQAFLYGMRHTATEKSEAAMHDPLRTDDGLAKAKAEKVSEMAEAIGRELFGRLYGEPERLEQPQAPAWMDKVHAALDGMPEWDGLRKSVHGDPDFSVLATRTMLDAITPRLAEIIKETKQEQEQQQQQQGGGDGQQQPRPPGPPGAGDALRAALRAACQQAQEKAQDGKDALNGLAPGMDGTPPADLQSETDRFDLLQAIMADRNFQEIARRAGRIKRISGRSERRRSVDVYEEVVDIELGSTIERLLPSETMQLLDEDLEMLALSRIMDNRAMQYRLEGHEPQGRGPVVFLRDVSGSMSGDGHLWGAAVGVALTAQTWKERRPMTSACFNTNVHNCRRLDHTGLYELTRKAEVEAQIAPGRLAAARAAMAHAKDGVSGGTDFTEPLNFAMRAGILDPRADFIFLTDGLADASPAALEKLNAAKATGLRVYGMTVNGGSVSPALKQICDEIIDIDACRNEGEVERRLGRMLKASR